MKAFYIDRDLRTSKIYIVPFSQKKDEAYVIECPNISYAEDLLKKLNYLGLKAPPINSMDFEQIDTYKESDHKVVAIYRCIL